jgi:hypothetical protein
MTLGEVEGDALAIATDAYAWGDEGHKVVC